MLALCWINLIEVSSMVCLGHTTLLEGQLQDQGSDTAVGGAVLLVQTSSCSHKSSCPCSPQHFFNQNRLYWQKDLLSLMQKWHSKSFSGLCFYASKSFFCGFGLFMHIFCIDFTLAVCLPLETALCVLQRCQHFCQLFQRIYTKKLCPVKGALKTEHAGGLILLKSMSWFCAG